MFFSTNTNPKGLLFLFVFLLTFQLAHGSESVLAKIQEARELVFLNRLDSAKLQLSQIDTSTFSFREKAEYNLTSGFLCNELGEREAALKNLSAASTSIAELSDDGLNAEYNLINAFIFEELMLRSEAAHSYFQAYDFFKDDKNPDRLFYTLLGIARTSTEHGLEYLNLAEEELKKLKVNRYHVLYLHAMASRLSDARERNNIMLRSLHYFDEQYDIKKQIYIYSGISLNYQLLDQADSALYYLNLADSLIVGNNIIPSRVLHFFIIKAFVEFNNDRDPDALQTLDVLFDHAVGQPGILSQAYLRRSLIMKAKGKYEEAYADLKLHTRQTEEERAAAERYQLGLLSIRYQVQQKEIELTKARYHLLLTIVLAIVSLLVLGWFFRTSSKRALKAKKEMEFKYQKTSRMLDEHVEESIKEAQLNNGATTTPNNSALKLQEFGAMFRVHHPLFREKLVKAHPDISVNDQKHCDFILAGMTAFQTTQLLGVSIEAVKKARKKLRLRFGFSSTVELHRYLQGIDEA